MRDHDDYDDQPICRVDDHPHPGPGHICERHLAGLREQLTALPGLVQALTHHLTPGGPAPAGGKVTTSRVGSPTPARLDVLTLVGPGCTEVRRDRRSLVPQIRRWSTVETVDVVDMVDGQPVHRRRNVRVFHRELVTVHRANGRPCLCGTTHDPDDPHFRDAGRGRPLVVLDDDQVGIIPPADWCDLWVRRWRALLALPAPDPTPPPGWLRRWRLPGDPKAGQRPAAAPTPLPHIDRVAEDQAARLADAAAHETLRAARGHPAALAITAAYLTTKAAYQAAVRAAVDHVGQAALGLAADGPHHIDQVAAALAGRRGARLTDDTQTAEWIIRYGGATTSASVEVDTAHLADWLPHVAAHDDADLPAFAAELYALTAELRHTLGITRDDVWLGRCPTELRDPDGEPSGRYCGYGLWHDPYLTRVECPRCHSVWAERWWLHLSTRIRTVWPIDPRRAYTDGDRKAALKNVDRLPRCRGCEAVMAVRWQPVPYRRGQRQPMWRPTGWTCPSGCIAGGTVAAA